MTTGVPTAAARISAVSRTVLVGTSEDLRDASGIAFQFPAHVIEHNTSCIENATGVELDLLDRKVAENEHVASIVHPGAWDHLEEPNLRFLWITALGSLAVLLLLLFYRTPRWLTANPAAVSYTFLLFAILLLLWCGFAIKLQQAEGRFNPNFATTLTSMQTMLFYESDRFEIAGQ